MPDDSIPVLRVYDLKSFVPYVTDVYVRKQVGPSSRGLVCRQVHSFAIDLDPRIVSSSDGGAEVFSQGQNAAPEEIVAAGWRVTRQCSNQKTGIRSLRSVRPSPFRRFRFTENLFLFSDFIRG